MLAQIIAEENGTAGESPSGVTDNPFLSEQLILCSTDFLEHCDMGALVAAEWDLLVVDEAHHLTWSEDHASEGYQRVERLAAAARGLLLLTATPEQLGQESHFARLRLLDPDRFHTLADFLEEQKHWQAVAAVAGNVALHHCPLRGRAHLPHIRT